jgi:hypothetical protein
MDPRTVVARILRFEGAQRLPRDFPEPFGSDFAWVGMTPSPDRRPREGGDEWGAVWENIGVCNLPGYGALVGPPGRGIHPQVVRRSGGGGAPAGGDRGNV